MTNEIDPKKVIAVAMLTSGAVTVCPDAPIRWSSGYLMPIYIDNRCLIGYPEVRKAIALSFKNTIETGGKSYDAIAGVATGGIPHATSLADSLNLPLLYVRAKAKEHGKGRQVEGDIEGGIAGKNILVIEDTVSTGGSVVNVIEALRNEGAIVSSVSTIYYYDLPNRESPFSKMTPPCDFSPLITFPYLLDVAGSEKLLDEKTIEMLREWFKSPFTWAEEKGFK